MILHRYFARRFLTAFLGTLATFLVILAFVDLIEQARRFGGEVPFAGLIALSALSLPGALYRVLPLITIIATLTLFLSLARSSELVVTRASGRSALRALWAPLVVTLGIGAVAVALVNPLVAATEREYESQVNGIEGRDRALALASDGLWLRQGGDEGQTVIHAKRTNLDGTVLWSATFLTFDEAGRPVRRVEAARAALEGADWVLRDAKSWPLEAEVPETAATRSATLTLPARLTADEIRAGFGAPSAIPIWDLPAYIERLSASGFTASRHQVWLQMELSLPVFLAAMVLVGAAFTMRHQRGGRTGMMVLLAILLSFGAYFLRNFVQVLGENGNLHPALAAWAPPVAVMLLTLGLILHLEDG